MKGLKSILAVSLMAISMAGPVLAQSMSLPAYMTADHNIRTSKLIGMTVYNDHNEKIGVIDDVMLPMAGGEVTAVLSVGGFIGTGPKLIKVPVSHVNFGTDKPMMPDGAKTALMAMPSYSYATGGG
jgi:sporulation protein YlmC with PRC-barrel domain